MFTYIRPYNNFSRGGRAFSKELNVRFVKNGHALPEAAVGKPRLEINWGCTSSTPYEPMKILNPAGKVKICSNKVAFFQKVKDTTRIPTFTTDYEEALGWVRDGIEVLGRKSRGSCGEDIVFSDDIAAFEASDFWVQYKKKESEFRIHVAFGKVISEQRKALRKTDGNGNQIDTSSVDFRIRNLKNGFVFVRNNITVPEDVTQQALSAVAAVGLDFGAVDVIFNATEGKAYVLEINTAPGLEGQTVLDYAAAFKEEIAKIEGTLS